jgi:hypothetical protein
MLAGKLEKNYSESEIGIEYSKIMKEYNLILLGNTNF